MSHTERHHIETTETIAMLCLRWGRKDGNECAIRLSRLLMILRNHHMGRRLCDGCLGLLRDAVKRCVVELGLIDLSVKRLRELAGEKS
jgi:hypothetical protein